MGSYIGELWALLCLILGHVVSYIGELSTKVIDAVLGDGCEDTTVDLINKAGYTAETYEVTTEDSYILTVHRYDTIYN